MADPDKPGQSLDYLEALLDYLACPIDASPLTAIRDPDGQVVALRSQNGTYPVVNNVPCMIPELASACSSTSAVGHCRSQATWLRLAAGYGGLASILFGAIRLDVSPLRKAKPSTLPFGHRSLTGRCMRRRYTT
jgi:uncharacterized protein YbaR (Trm112 family)